MRESDNASELRATKEQRKRGRCSPTYLRKSCQHNTFCTRSSDLTIGLLLDLPETMTFLSANFALMRPLKYAHALNPPGLSVVSQCSTYSHKDNSHLDDDYSVLWDSLELSLQTLNVVLYNWVQAVHSLVSLFPVRTDCIRQALTTCASPLC